MNKDPEGRLALSWGIQIQRVAVNRGGGRDPEGGRERVESI